MQVWEGDPGWGSGETFYNHRRPASPQLLTLGSCCSLQVCRMGTSNGDQEVALESRGRGMSAAEFVLTITPPPVGASPPLVLRGATAAGVIPPSCQFRGPYSPCSGKPGWTDNVPSWRWLEFPQPSVGTAVISEEVSLKHKKGKRIITLK